jgi:lipopolysaccharide biosynthesis regulator YciM
VQPYLTLGNLYRLSGETQRSIVIHQNLMTDESLSKTMRDRVRIELACDLVEHGMDEQAYPHLQEVNENSPMYLLAQEKLAELYYKHEDFEKGFVCILNILHKKKSWRNRKRAGYFLALQAEKLLHAGDMHAAKKYIDRVAGFDQDCVLAHFLKGEIALEEHEFDLAIESFTQIMRVNRDFAFLAIPKIEDAFYGKQSFMRLGENLQVLSDSFPNNAFLSFSLGKFYRKKKMFQEARRYLRQTIELNPTFLPGREEMLNLDLEENKLPEAAAEFQDLLDETKSIKHFICVHCQTRYPKLVWTCSSCGRWETVHADLYLKPNVIHDSPIAEYQASHS